MLVGLNDAVDEDEVEGLLLAVPTEARISAAEAKRGFQVGIAPLALTYS